MNQRELTEGRRDKGFLAQVGEEIGTFHRLVAEKHVEGKVATFHLITNGRPFGENDGTDTVGSHQCKSIAPKNVPAEHIADALQVIVGFRIGEKRDVLSIEDAEEAFLAFRHIVLLDFDAVEASHGNEGLEFILRPALAVKVWMIFVLLCFMIGILKCWLIILTQRIVSLELTYLEGYVIFYGIEIMKEIV